jgi:MFS family permease
MLAVLRQRNFGLLWIGQLISILGDYVLTIALPFFIYDRTGSVAATGLMFVVEALPRVTLGTIAGVFVDRWDRKRTMIASDLLRAGLLLPLLLAGSPETLWIVYVVGFLQSLISLFFSPAESAVLPQIVAKEDLLAANSASSVADASARIVGPAIGGALLGILGFGSVVLFDSASFLVSALTIVMIAVPKLRSEPGRAGQAAAPATSSASLSRVWHELVEGLRVIHADSLLSGLLAVLGIVVLGDGFVSVVGVAYTKSVLHAGPTEFGYVMTAQGAGAVFGGFLVGRAAKAVAPGRLVTVGFLAMGVAILGIVVTANLTAAYVLMFFTGAPNMGARVGVQTLLQQSVANQFRGRVFGTVNTTVALSSLSGMGLATVLGAAVGVATFLGLAGVLYLLGSSVALAVLPTRDRARPTEAA